MTLTRVAGYGAFLLAWLLAGTAQGGDGGSEVSRRWFGSPAGTFEGPISTDRPTFSLGASTMPPGRVQIETGYTFSFENAHPDVRTHSGPEALWRLGLIDHVEFRVEWPTVTAVDDGKTRDGLRDLGIGMKAQVFQQTDWLPQVSLSWRLSIPTGHASFSSDRVDPEFRTILAYTVNERVGLFGNVGFAAPTVSHTRFVQVFSSAGATALLRDQLTGFVEYFGLYPREIAGGSGHVLQSGLLYLATSHLQLDLRIGAGLTHGTDDFLTGAGVSWRF